MNIKTVLRYIKNNIGLFRFILMSKISNGSTQIPIAKKYYYISIFNKKIPLFKRSSLKFNFKEHDIIQKITSDRNNTKNKIAIVSIFKNEAKYLEEWIEYHRLIGINKFYLYNNESNDNYLSILNKYIKNGIVVLHNLSGTSMQLTAYNDAIARYEHINEWMAFIDIDEFIVPVKEDNINVILDEFKYFSGIGINWLFFDHSGYINPDPEKLVVEMYTRTNIPDTNHHIKTIAKPLTILFFANPHYAVYKNGHCVSENKDIIWGPFSKNTSLKKIQLNHYYSKSISEFKKKINRGCADSPYKRQYSDESVKEFLIFQESTINDKQNTVIFRFLPELKKVLAKKCGSAK